MPPVVAIPEIRRYLLGELDEDRAAALEAQYFADPALFDEVWAVEHDLVDEYVSGSLPDLEREPFERHYLATEVHRTRVATARALEARIPSTTPGRVLAGPWHTRPVLRWATAAALAAMASGAGWLVTRPGPAPVQQADNQSTPPADDPRRAAPSSVAGDSPYSPPAAPQAAEVPAPVLLAVTLSSVATRASEQQSVRIPPKTTHIVLRLEGERTAGQAPVHVEVRSIDGRRVWSGGATATGPESGLIGQARLPADLLVPDDYLITASAANGGAGARTELSRYFLRIAAR